MKKLLLLICIIPYIMACNSKPAGNAADSTKMSAKVIAPGADTIPKGDTLITLNGIGKSIADTMQKHFIKYRGQDKNPIQKSFWFDSTAIHRMYNLLVKEGDDGIRIYFVSDTTITSGQLSNSIILVSTKKIGEDTTVPSGAIHLDYYEHAKNDPLFSDLPKIKGAPSTKPPGIIITDGQNLYNDIYPGAGDNSSCNDPDYISRRRAHKMLKFFGNEPIRTKSEWFSRDLLGLFVADTKHNGIRIYFARHPKSYKYLATHPIEYKTDKDTDYLKEAFILVTTKPLIILGKPIVQRNDYFDCRTIEDFLFNPIFSEWYKRHPLGNGGSGADDNGELCPPHCN